MMDARERMVPRVRKVGETVYLDGDGEGVRERWKNGPRTSERSVRRVAVAGRFGCKRVNWRSAVHGLSAS